VTTVNCALEEHLLTYLLEYAIQAWFPYLQKDIQCLENVQRVATRLISGFKKLSYEERLRAAGLKTLDMRRQRGDLIKCYKILTGKENIDPQQFFHLSDNVHGLHGHSLKLPLTDAILTSGNTS